MFLYVAVRHIFVVDDDDVLMMMNCFCGMVDWTKVCQFLFSAGTFVSEWSYHCVSPTRREQDLNRAEPEFMLSGMTLYSSDNHYTTVVIVVFVEVEQGSANAYWVVYGRVIVLFPSHKHLFYEKPIFFAWVSIYWTYWLKLGWYFLNTLLKFYLFILFNCLFS